jgi:hypothetical protein
MKLSKAAMRTRHVKLAHLTMTPVANVDETPKQSERPRIYSTERYSGSASNNGIPIPQKLRDQIEATMLKPEAENELPAFIGGWGFF